MFFSEPSHLPLGIATGLNQDSIERLSRCRPALHRIDDLPVADGLEARNIWINPLLQQSSDLGLPASTKHRLRTQTYPIVQNVPIQGQCKGVEWTGKSRRLLLGNPVQLRSPGGFEDLQRSSHPLAVCRMQLVRHSRIDLRQGNMKSLRPFPLQSLPNRIPNTVWDVRNLRYSLRQGAKVESRPADQDRMTTLEDLLQNATCLPCIPTRGEGLCRIQEVVEVMGHSGPFLQRRLRGPDVEPAIDLECVAIDDLCVDPLREFNRDPALAGGGRAENRNDSPERPRPPGTLDFGQLDPLRERRRRQPVRPPY